MPLPPRTLRLLEYASIGAILVLYALLKSISTNIVTSDSGVYYYAGSLWSQGIVPYRDFFFSHGPVHVLVPAIVIFLFGVSIPLLNAIPSILLSGTSGWLVYRIARGQWGALAGILASVLYLFGPNQLVQSGHFTGINLTTMFLLLGVERFLQRKYLQAGLALGTGMMAGAYILPGIVVIGLIALMDNWRSLRPLIKGFMLVVVPVHLFFLAIAGLPFLEQLYFYHVQKVAESPYFVGVSSVVSKLLEQEQLLILFSLLGLHVFLLTQCKAGKALQALRSWPLAPLSLLLVADYLFFFSALSRSFTHYFLLLFPFAAIAGSYGLVSFLKIRLAFPWRWSERAYGIIVLVLIASVSLKVPFAGIPNFSRVTWANHFLGAHDLAIYLNSVLQEDETIFGSFDVTPTVALLSGRRIAANEVESSIMRLEGKPEALSELIERIEEDNVGAVISRVGSGVHSFPAFREYLAEHFTPERNFVGAAAFARHNVMVWLRKKD
jgi:hypothetical protein